MLREKLEEKIFVLKKKRELIQLHCVRRFCRLLELVVAAATPPVV
jgi:hypothetical protein